jgi:tRNA pseudouridine38-40 synthase
VRAFRLAYDGRPFHGFQRQPDVGTVEGTLLAALAALGVDGATSPAVAPDKGGTPPSGGGSDAVGTPPPGYAAAGRTDAGVSALAQTVAFEAPDWCTPRALNGELPEAVRAWASAPAPEGFHATLAADRRSYTYFLYGPGLDDERARATASALAGEHDFHNLTPDDEGTVRDLSIALERDGPFLVVRVAAAGFARELVRRVVSLVRAVAACEADLGTVETVLGPAPVDGPLGVPPAPPRPLVLTGVRYPGLRFSADAEAVESARSVFEQRRVDAVERTRVAATLAGGVGDTDRADGAGGPGDAGSRP